MTTIDEGELRRRFAELREDDGKRTPTFARLYARGPARRSWRAMFRPRLLAIGAAAAVATAAVLTAHARSSPVREGTPPISTWRAPTDILLRTPGSELLSEMPALGESVLDTMIPKPSKTGA